MSTLPLICEICGASGAVYRGAPNQGIRRLCGGCDLVFAALEARVLGRLIAELNKAGTERLTETFCHCEGFMCDP